MRLPMKARHTLSLLAATGLLAACAGESTAPAAVQKPLASQFRPSSFVPTAAQRSLVGVADGTYTFTVDAGADQAITLGPNYLGIPANSICDLATSSYGPSHWSESCTPQTGTVVVTAIVRNATTDHPSIDFYPAMRFDPANSVNLYIYVPVGMENFQTTWAMKYCADDSPVCIDESFADPDLRSFADLANQMVFRRIKHFSGYVVTGVTDEGGETPPPSE